MSQVTAFIGRSAAALGVLEEIACAAQCDAKVMIVGESGVGKEVVARLIHRESRRSCRPLVTINCAGVPDSLLESELFGHVKGSFTDAYADKRGRLEGANSGTVFLDEVGEMSPRMQALLLRFLETGEIQRLGSDRPLPPLDVRVITATHRNLIEHVREKTFREDLYYRLNVIHIRIPPLRERRDDVESLLHHTLRLASAAHHRPEPVLTPGALAALVAYDWPGNVRELRNVCERLLLQQKSPIEAAMLPVEIRVGEVRPAAGVAPGPIPVAHDLFTRLVEGRESFWSSVYEPFMARDLTRKDVRELVRLGLERSSGNYKQLLGLYNMADAEYKRFLSFLRKYGCHVPFQTFRMARATLPSHQRHATQDEPPGSVRQSGV